ncbi:hypothetical protein B0T17DRAFT_478743, partial [Bombardia bombarda]
PDVGVAVLSSRRLIEVSGPDAAKYLQGVITGNISSLLPAASTALDPSSSAPTTTTAPQPSSELLYAAFLSAKGRILYDVFIYHLPTTPDSNTFLIDVAASEAAALAAHIKRYKLRAKFSVRVLPPAEQPAKLGGRGEILLAAPDPRAPGLGVRVLLAPSPSSDGQQIPEHESERLYTLRRYTFGVPEGPQELLRDVALPLESNMDVMGGVDFHKGCYVGQELTIRTKHRGVVRKRVLPCVVYRDGQGALEGGGQEGQEVVPARLEYRSGEELAEAARPGSDIARAGGAGGKERSPPGKWLAGVGNLGLALCKLEVMTDVRVAGAEAAGPGGYSAGWEFTVVVAVEGEKSDGGVLKVKAFVPEWLRERLTG